MDAPADANPFDLSAELVRVQAALRVYVRTLIPNRTDADEVVQATNATVWANRARFRPGTNFRGWVLRVALYQVKSHRKRYARERRQFGAAVFDLLAARAAAAADAADLRHAVLAGCVATLPPADRELLRLRYDAGLGVPAIAARKARSVATVYRDLDRIHLTLLTAVRAALDADEGGAACTRPNATA
jgi:RNA polymerase sigma-70 factor, ECF subfamily